MQSLTNRLRLALEPECPENLTATARENTQGWSGLAQRHSSCLWFQIFGVEAHSSLPYGPHNRGRLSRQGQARHLRSHPLGQQSCVKFLERTRFDPSDGRGTLKQVLQIVIAVSIESANRYLLPGSLQPSLDFTVIGTACISMPKPLYFQSGRLLRKRCGVWISAINSAARIGPIQGIWRSTFVAGCCLLSLSSSRRTSSRNGLKASSC